MNNSSQNKSIAVAALAVMATLLLIANLIPLPGTGAAAATSIKDRDYQLATARSVKGGEVLYVLDNRTGTVGALAWDAASRSVKPVAIESLTNLFK
ncbi:MAG TPA: hypothetical protein VF624_11820 [Tepidisphaeraceae bacterium]|jgi:hypothetical protein